MIITVNRLSKVQHFSRLICQTILPPTFQQDATIYGKISMRKISHFEWKTAIHGKTFAVAVLLTYIADRQGHNLQEKIHGRVKNHKNCESFPLRTFSRIWYFVDIIVVNYSHI